MNILIVEDNKETLYFLKSSLEGEGFVVDTAEEGRTGSQKARKKNYDLIILDNMLPEKDGRQICSEVRGRGNYVPILMLSVNAEIDAKVDLLNAGADDYLTKPFSFKELLARINALMRRPKEVENETLKVDDLTLNTRSRKVMRGIKRIKLSPKEFILMEYMMRNKGKVLSRMSIVEHVWDMNADPFSNTIETHMVNLRRKMKFKSGRDLIHTIQGVGYKVE